MGRKCCAKPIEKFELVDTEIRFIYESHITEWSNGGAYIPIPTGHNGKKVYVVVRK